MSFCEAVLVVSSCWRLQPTTRFLPMAEREMANAIMLLKGALKSRLKLLAAHLP